jgi:hypothetical protein
MIRSQYMERQRLVKHSLQIPRLQQSSMGVRTPRCAHALHSHFFRRAAFAELFPPFRHDAACTRRACIFACPLPQTFPLQCNVCSCASRALLRLNQNDELKHAHDDDDDDDDDHHHYQRNFIMIAAVKPLRLSERTGGNSGRTPQTGRVKGEGEG